MALCFYFDMYRCSGCRACQVACKDKNRLDVGTIFRQAFSFSVGSFPDVRGYAYSASCNHCNAPACVENCPTGAMHKAEDGTVVHDDEMCIGCATCTKECPYGVPRILPSGIAGKCDACQVRRAAGGNPVCVDACPNRALDFGEREDLLARHGGDATDRIAVLPSAETTGPNVLIRAKPAAHEAAFADISW